jgi:pentatricopeptide repeat protein
LDGAKELLPYNVLMYGLCRNNRVLEAVQVKNGMVERGVKGLRLMNGFSRTEALEMAMEMTDDMLRLGFVPSEASCSFMLHGLRKRGCVEEAFRLACYLVEFFFLA